MAEHGDQIFSFGAWVRRRRKALDLTQAALAQRVGCAEVTIRKLEADAFRPSREIADRLAGSLDIPAHERELFVQTARAERSVDSLPAPLVSIDRALPQTPTADTPSSPHTLPASTNASNQVEVARYSPPDRKRQAMLTKIAAIWIAGVLKRSLYQEVLITLALTDYPAAVLRPHDLLVQRPGTDEFPLPPNTTITEVFDQANGELLIFGAPGAGKTTLLLEILRHLLKRAEFDSGHAIPVVFPLSTWGERELSLAEWLADELVQRYGVPTKLAQAWIDTDQILPLLDGLDEVAQNHRGACVEAINTYREQRGLLPLVVCSRIADYAMLTVKLQLHAAVKVQPLSDTQIDAYLTSLGSSVAAVQTALQADPTLRHLLDTPLMLHIVTLTYAGCDTTTLGTPGQLENRRQQLLSAYVLRMLTSGSTQHHYSLEQTCQWLGWLAWQMQRHNQTVFYLERIQPDWLPVQQRWMPTIGVALVIGLIMSVVGGVPDGLIYGLQIGVFSGLICGLLSGSVAGYSNEIEHVEVLHWSWPNTYEQFRLPIIYGLLVGLFFGLAVDLTDGLVSGLLVSFIGIFLRGLRHTEIEVKLAPNQGMKRSIHYSMIIGLITGLVCGIVEGLFLGVVDGIGYGLFFALVAGLVYGGRTYLQHMVLRRLLAHNKCAPWKYPDFLEHATSRILLRKVGGGYIFIHRLLQEYFAEQYIAASPGSKHAAE